MASKNPFKRRALYGIGAIILIAVVIIAQSKRSGGDKPIIRTATVERGTVTASVSANGVLQPLTTVQVKSNVGGQVMKLAVDEGDRVRAGQLIAKIDTTDSVTSLDQSRADLDSANSKVNQARQQLTMQHTQNEAQIDSAKQGLAASKAKLDQAKAQSGVQPALTSSAINQAKSNLAAAVAGLKQTKVALIPQKIASAQSASDQAKSTYSTTQKDLVRQRELLSKGFVSTSLVEATEEKFNSAKAQLDKAQRKLDTIQDETNQDLLSAQAKVLQAQAGVDGAEANRVQDKLTRQELVSAQAAVRQANAALQSAEAAKYQDQIRNGDIIQAGSQVKRSQAALTNAEKQLAYTTVTAPRGGIVIKKYVEEGSIVTAGKSSFSGSGSGVGIVDIADTSRMFALVNVDETDIAQIKVGQEVSVIVDAYANQPFTGRVTKIAPQSVTDQNVTTIPVTVEINSPDMRLKPGMNATCDFIIGKKSDVLMVPNEAIKDSGGRGSTVTLLQNDNQVKQRVRVGLVGADYSEIIKGVKEGDKVVTAVIETQPAAQAPGGAGAGRPGGSGGMRGPGGMGGPGGMRR